MQNCTGVDEVLWRNLNLETPAFVAQLLPQLIELVRASRRLPLGEEHAIRRGSRDFLNASRDLGQRSIRQAHRTLRFLDARTHHHTTPEELGNFNVIIDSIDNVLERVDGYLRDAIAGRTEAPVEEEETAVAAAFLPAGGRSGSGTSRSGPKPQVRWRQLVDNERVQFVPRILVKHNQRAPLQARLLAAQRKAGLCPCAPGQAAEAAAGSVTAAEGALRFHLEAMGVGCRPEDSVLPHPYDEELASLTWSEQFFKPCRSQRYTRMEDTPLVLVRTEIELRQMVQEIKVTCAGKEIAVDVEHHDFRSYRGFVCLIQVSTRQKDFIVDPFDIFPQMHLLNEVFSDPNILKVLHGSDRDVHWLQRDFSVYLVNMFDTGQAARALRLQGGFSLANLVSIFCGVKLDKKYQTADWRERPLPAEMLHYARADTHFLLYCYDCLRNALLGQHGSVSGFSLGLVPLESGELQVTEDGVHTLQSVLDKSTALCRTQYMEAPLDAGNVAMGLCERFSSKQHALEAMQFSTLQALIQWRDRLARTSDESWNFIAPDACLWRVALAMPSSPSRLRSTCNPLPPKLQQHADEVVELVARCLETATRASATAPALEAPASSSSAPRPAAPTGPSGSMHLAPPDLTRPVWPTRSLENSPRPLVHVTAACGSGTSRLAKDANGSAALNSGTVLCAFVESESSAEEEGVETVEAPKPAINVQAIRGAIRFATAAPVAPPAPLASLQRAPEMEAPEEAAIAAVASAAPLRSKKRKRNLKLAASKSLEALVSGGAEQAADIAADAYGATVAAEAAPEYVEVEALMEAEAEVEAVAEAEASAPAPGPGPAKKRKKGKKVQQVARTIVDPYL